MDIGRLKAIFIEEASEIIEKLDIDIVNLEDAPDDKGLLNELFRGVHTLKGSANSFGFEKLGRFVHAFEDVLDYYRSSSDVPTSGSIDIFLNAVDMIKSIFEAETSSQGELPEGYDSLLGALKNILDKEKNNTIEQEPSSDLADEFGSQEIDMSVDEGESLYKITVRADNDLYIRGQDHKIFIKNLLPVSSLKESSWTYENIPTFDSFEPTYNYLKEMVIYVGALSKSELEEVFEFIDESEWSIEKVEKTIEAPQSVEETPAKEESENLESKIEEIKEIQKTVSTKQEKQESDIPRSFIKIDTAKLDELFDSVGELVVAQNSLAENDSIKSIQDEILQKTIESLTKITRLVQSRVMSLRMVPIKDTFEKMRRVIRDSSRKVNKEVKLHISGEDTEIDKTMVDSLSDPLIHILRNSVDHGIEPDSNDRVKSGKEVEGNIHLRAYHKGGSIVIEIEDDGRGINREKVYKKALEKKLINEDENLTDQQVFALIMQPGFSTADQISDISGRGVGLDVVRTSIESLRGKVEIDSKPGSGTRFSIYLPLTLAIIDGMLVESADEVFIIPTLSIIESFRPTKDMIHKAEGKGEFVKLRDEFLPVVRLDRALGLANQDKNPWDATLVCSESEKGKFALMVDELIGRQQVVIKPLGKLLSHLKEISGGAVMGNGEIALILNIEGIY